MIIDAPKDGFSSELRSLWQEAFGDDDSFLNAFEKTAFSPDRCRCVILDGQVASALYWFDTRFEDERIAYLYAIATRSIYQGKGVCTTLMKDTHRHLASLGYTGAILVPGTDSLFAFYRRLGYKTCTYIREITALPTDPPLVLQKICAEEYEKHRRALLPKDGVIQENESIRFLEEQASFYRADGLLLAARQTADLLYGIELLGNTKGVGGIVRALGCKEGRFRTVGEERPFTMYLSLGEKSMSPRYFGLAFD